ncbi:hypothetical protein BC834DRAFT_921395 [Gloeopeniophorella convolvens]|nr:hypothetical protein BC834DRAFT_921395 [Gloeopeniophorella convolvens]
MSTSSPSILTPAQATSNTTDEKTPYCGVCRRQFSRYTCPRCNMLYCSLSCFRSEAHSQCSEPFYRDQLASDIGSEPSASVTERKAMMDLLKRFEEDNLDDPFSNPEDGDVDEDDLERRLAGMDLDSTSVDQIWAALSSEERERFTRALQDPESELAKTLLTSPDLADDIPAPWWTGASMVSVNAPASRPAQAPDVMVISEALLKAPVPPPPTPAFPLANNLVAILCVSGLLPRFHHVAYAYASRHLSAYPLAPSPEARDLVSRLLPFLVVRDDKTRFPGIESASTDVFSRFEEGSMTPSAFALLVQDAATLLRPPLVMEGDSSMFALRALSDLHALYKASAPRIAAKVMFYAAQAHRAPSSLLRSLAADAERWAAKLKQEDEDRIKPESVSETERPQVAAPGRPLIAELP